MITNQKISLSNKLSQVEGIIVSDMGGEKVMLSIAKGKYFNLGEMGGEIWDLMKEAIEVKQIISVLESIYQVDQEECEEQVLTFLSQLFDQELIKIND
ncbi:coenzyme PQQ synthesis protein D (PqqD) [Cytobacillus firmus]|uniref:Coenzyme PQQ synthesis protein D (PqqD) n=2 Tax=Cytobacillus TaxID=2675230 RepID=A0A366JN01_CYTFI|nr:MULTISPECIES: lasso peptide biosynthesis PqqD family chaperone [Cytobacillus]RBP88293.1 coenzyme PQQ synthesis protein D (PqqD) [Cytobacillus firmus]TDX38366.1 coenzyme PQQ synthesis protein D (PqqD) [Cytobacillus oceanisediminis]